jgi:hypothetical protein
MRAALTRLAIGETRRVIGRVTTKESLDVA